MTARNLRAGLTIRADSGSPFTIVVRVLRGLQLRLCRRLYFDFDKCERNTVLIAGSGRSGTTWLAELANFDNSYRMLFEPFHPTRVKEWSDFCHRQYLAAKRWDPKAYSAVRTILRGAFRNSWADSHNRKMMCRKRLIKEIAANNMLGYIRHNFPRTSIIYIVRHPCAVAASRLRLGWDKYPDPTVRTDLNVFLQQPGFVEDVFGSSSELFERPYSTFSKEIAFWAAENYLPLRLFYGSTDVKVVFYEELVINSVREVGSVAEYLGKKPSPRLWARVPKLSGTAGYANPIRRSQEELIAGWKKSVSEQSLKDAMSVLGDFGLDRFYGEDPLPLVRPR